MDTRESMLEKLMLKAGDDADFRGRLLGDPRSALKEAFDIEVPDDFNVEVLTREISNSHLGVKGKRLGVDTPLCENLLHERVGLDQVQGLHKINHSH